MRVIPAGSPVADHVYGSTPPAADNVAEYARPVAPGGNEEVVIAGSGWIVMLIAAVAASPLVSVTLTVNVEVPATLGLPRIAPVAVFKVSPEGRDPEFSDQV